MTAHPDLPPSTRPTLSWRTLRASLRDLALEGRLKEYLARCRRRRCRSLHETYIGRAGDHQVPPDEAAAWHTWLMLGGRGAGKTRAGAEWVNGMAGGLLGIAERRAMRIALVGETLADVRDVMVEGLSGLVATVPCGRAAAVGAVAAAARMAERRRGPRVLGRGPGQPARAAVRGRLVRRARQVAPCGETWDMLQFGLRLGARPRQVVTTTPRPIPLIGG